MKEKPISVELAEYWVRKFPGFIKNPVPEGETRDLPVAIWDVYVAAREKFGIDEFTARIETEDREGQIVDIWWHPTMYPDIFMKVEWKKSGDKVELISKKLVKFGPKING